MRPPPDEALFEGAFDGAPIGIAIVAPDGRIVRANRALAQLLGRPVTELTGRTVHEFGHPDDAAVRLPDRAGILDGTVGHSAYVKRYLRADASTVWLRVTTSRIGAGSDPLLLSHFADVTNQELATRAIRYAASHDALTGLTNRTRLMELLDQALAASGPGTSPDVALLFIDLDDFKLVNDSLGHETGDQVLRVLGRRLAHAVRAGEVGRFGGDEFVVLCRALDGDEVPALCTRLLEVLSEPVEIDGRVVQVGASIGVAYPGAGSSATGLLRDADAAMYSAKRAGRGRYMVSDEVVRGFAMAVLEGDTDLRAALNSGALFLRAQPIRDLRSLEPVTVEMLARWSHPVRGELSPAEFLGLPTRAGLASAFGRWALAEACRQRGRWAARCGNPDLRVSVNLDAEHLVDPSLVADVRAALADAGLGGRSLTVEITERAVVDAFPANMSRLGELVDSGVRLSLDDFGTGWSSLSYLRLLPVAELKVDRTFVAGAASSERDAVILSGVAAIGCGLGLSVIAEGIETGAELAAARAAGCGFGQGYLLGRPSLDGSDWPSPEQLRALD